MPFLIVDTPERVKWLSDDEKRFVDLRLRLSGVRTNTEEGDKFSWKMFFGTMLDWKVILGIFLAWANSVPNAAFKFTMPQIIKQLGFSTAQSQLLSMPPYVCGGVAAWLTGRFSDRLSWRMPFIVGPMSVLLVAMAVLFKYSADVAQHVPVMYVGVVLAQIGIYPLLPGISAWTGNNLAPSWKRSIGLAWMLAAGNLGSKSHSYRCCCNELTPSFRHHRNEYFPGQGGTSVSYGLRYISRCDLSRYGMRVDLGILSLATEQSQGQALRDCHPPGVFTRATGLDGREEPPVQVHSMKESLSCNHVNTNDRA
jgi:hypothetical protein